MTVDVPTAVLVGGALSAIVGGAAWVARTTVLDRLTALEAKHDASARRFGEGDHALDKRLAIVEAKLEWTTK